MKKSANANPHTKGDTVNVAPYKANRRKDRPQRSFRLLNPFYASGKFHRFRSQDIFTWLLEKTCASGNSAHD